MNVASAIQVVASVSWLLFIGAIIFVVMQAARRRSIKGLVTLIIVAGVVALLLSTVSAGLVFIQPDQRGVVVSAVAPKGYREQALQPGLRWIVPFFENVVTYTISRQTYTMSIAQQEGNIIGDDITGGTQSATVQCG